MNGKGNKLRMYQKRAFYGSTHAIFTTRVFLQKIWENS
jgi:hypothetical protein